MNDLKHIPEIKTLFRAADYVGIKTVDTDLSLERFLIRIFSYRPALIRLLYRLRAPLVRLLGFKQDPMPDLDEWIPAEFPMFPCGQVWFFTVQQVQKELFWIAGCPRDRHLDAEIAVVVRPLAGKLKRFYLITVVRYKHWTGPVYFALIRLFNLFLINRMARYAGR
jgi:hypothetical protein